MSSHSAGQRPAQVVGQVVALARGARHLEQADRAIGALDGEAAVRERDVAGIGLQRRGRRCAWPSAIIALRRLAHHDAGHAHRAAECEPPPTGTMSVSPWISRTLLERRRRAIRRRIARSSSRGPGRSTACRSRHRRGLPAARDLGAFARRRRWSTRCSWRARCRAACRCACDSRLRLAKPFQSASASARSITLLVVAAVVGHAERVGVGLRRRRDQVAPPQVDAVEAELRARRCRSAARSRTSPPAGRRCDRDWSAACC